MPWAQITAISKVGSPAEGPELTAKLELQTVCLACGPGSEALQEHLMGLRRRKGGEEECEIMRNAGLQETEAEQVLQTIQGEERWPLTFFSLGGAGPGKR